MANWASVGARPSMKNELGTIAPGDFSRESSVEILPVSPSRKTMKPPPPMPQL